MTSPHQTWKSEIDNRSCVIIGVGVAMLLIGLRMTYFRGYRTHFQPRPNSRMMRLICKYCVITEWITSLVCRMQYIEQEMSKKNAKAAEPEVSGYEAKIKALYQLPDRLKVESNAKKTEEMLSNQMLSGIPEVDLGVE